MEAVARVSRIASSRLARATIPRRLARAAWCSIVALASPLGAQAADAPRPPNLVLIVLDDFGVDLLGAFPRAEGVRAPCTPNLDELVREGLLFTHVWSDPVCSASRAQILSGRHGFRTGIGKGIGKPAGSLRLDLEDPLPRMLNGYDSSAIGKWHLVSQVGRYWNHPLDASFGYYAGSLFNLHEQTPLSRLCWKNGQLGYENWVKTYDVRGNGVLDSRCTTTYATTDTTDEAIGRMRLMRPPWFLYVAYNAPHWPMHDPPSRLCPNRPEARDRPSRLEAVVEALDTEPGRLLAEQRALDPAPIVFVVGDNGTDPGSKGDVDKTRSKLSLYEGGIHVPMIAAGPGVARGTCPALVSTVDLYATFVELAGGSARAEDSISLVPYLRGETTPVRRTVYAEVFHPNQPCDRLGEPFLPARHGRAVRDERYKFVIFHDPDGAIEESFFDLELDPEEGTNLVAPGTPDDEAHGLTGEPRARYLALRAELRALSPE